MTRISTSMKRATISFTDPEVGRSTYQECEGKVDHNLRAAIRAAHRAFNKVYPPKKAKG